MKVTVRKIHYVTGSRADFGLMARSLQHLAAQPGFDIGVVVTGQHLIAQYGDTRADIIDAGLTVVGDIPVILTGHSGAEMGHALAEELGGFLRLWQRARPDLVLVLGDRGEMLAAALAAVHLGLPVAHLHGGEVSGTLDESLRHAISKLSHYHFTATQEAANRLIRMGENPEHVWVVGAPGLVGLTEGINHDPEWLGRTFNVPAARHHILVMFHPVVQEAAAAGAQMQMIVDLLAARDCAGILMRPNSDAGGAAIDAVLNLAASELPGFMICDHMSRPAYLRTLAHVDMMIGNSSSGIIESASFDLPCVNLGTRQDGRQRNKNVVDCPQMTPAALTATFDEAAQLTGPFENLYGDGQTHEYLSALLQGLVLDPTHLSKRMTY